MSYAVLALVLLAGCAGPARRGEGTSLLVTGRSVAGHPGADAVLIREGRVAAVGLAAELEAERRLETGGELSPGFHDSHLHLLDGGLSLSQVLLDDATSEAEAVRLIALHPAKTGTLRGRGWNYNIVPMGTYPTRRALDAVVMDRPVIMESFDGHAYWLNTKALENAGALTPGDEPEGAIVITEPDGTAQGTVLEVGAEFLERAGGRLSRAEKTRGVRAGLARLAAAGVTAAVVMSADLEEFDVLEALERRGELTARIFYCPPLEGDLDVYEDLRRRAQGPRLHFGWLKGFVDGVIETRTAYMLEPYAGSAERGAPAIAPDTLMVLVGSAQARGFSVALHAVGDAGVRLALDAYEAADRVAPRPARRRRVEHLEVVDPADLPRFAALDVVASMQPLHAAPGPDDGAWARNLGPERRARSFPWRALLDAGAVLAFGSDWPVVSPEALEGIALAAAKLSPAEALRGYTAAPAHAARMPELGCLYPGCLADVVAVSSGVTHVIVEGRQVR